MTYLQAIFFLYKRRCDGFLRSSIRTAYFYLRGKAIATHHRAVVKGTTRISIAQDKTLTLGVFPNNFSAPSDVTFLNVMGKLDVNGHFEIGRGARISIGDRAVVSLGSGFINNSCVLAIEHRLSIGNDCAIGWNVQIMDDDFHSLIVDGETSSTTNDGVQIGNHVWIGSNVTILKNVTVPDGCVVAAGSIVNRKFSEADCLIAGSPAKVIKRNILWR